LEIQRPGVGGFRQALLTKLLVLSQPVEATLEALARFGWDSDDGLVVLELRHVENVLRRDLADELPPMQLQSGLMLSKKRGHRIERK